jgi:hypothetical protein
MNGGRKECDLLVEVIALREEGLVTGVEHLLQQIPRAPHLHDHIA